MCATLHVMTWHCIASRCPTQMDSLGLPTCGCYMQVQSTQLSETTSQPFKRTCVLIECMHSLSFCSDNDYTCQVCCCMNAACVQAHIASGEWAHEYLLVHNQVTVELVAWPAACSGDSSATGNWRICSTSCCFFEI